MLWGKKDSWNSSKTEKNQVENPPIQEGKEWSQSGKESVRNERIVVRPPAAGNGHGNCIFNQTRNSLQAGERP